MNLVFPLIVAILATFSQVDGAQSKQLGPCEGVTNIRDFSHCIKKRQSCQSCNDCENDCEQSCDECGGNYQTNSNSQNNVDIQSRQINENPQENRITVNLLNTVHNLNKIHNPIEVENSNHFFYDQKTSQRINSQNNNSFVEVGRLTQPCSRMPIIRQPMFLPPYMPPPPPCYYMQSQPYFGCQTGPAPVIVPACAPCFYCQGKYNPAECSKKKECKESCKKLLCGNVPCYPQIVSCNKDKDEDETTEKPEDDQ